MTIVLSQATESITIIVWTIAILTLFLQLYLMVTWPRQQTSDTIPVPDRPTSEPRHKGRRASGSMLLPDRQRPLDPGYETVSEIPETPQRRSRRHAAPPSFRDRVIRAGLYKKTSPATVYLVRIALTIAAFLIVYLAVTSTTAIVEIQFLAAGFAGIAAYIAPSFWLDHRLKIRQVNIRRALPDALDLITVCMRGGLSLPGALARVSRELAAAHPLLAAELAIVEREIQMGRTAGAAMRHFAQRLDLEELRSLSSVVWQTEKFGGSIVGALATYASTMRIKRRQHAEEMAQKAAVKLLFPTLLCIFPGIFVVVLGPTAIRVYQILLVNNPIGG